MLREEKVVRLEAEVEAGQLEREDWHCWRVFKPEEAYSDNTRMTTTPAVDQVKVDKMGQLEALRAEHKNVKDQLTNDLEALDGPMGSTDELEKVEKERKALHQSAFLPTPPSERLEAESHE
ncbi:hypothetical protein BKA70DRAFT_1432968 [Coprinopsis sp. MPI-PUGE-AT-0042]|nr:hypothetical protein BKA70DRAFT_1432968 [Coprinopsis sp. MPI-PUGE-AT-0042]